MGAGRAVGVGPPSYRKSCYIGRRESKETVPERPRRESSTNALKAAVNTGGLSYPHKGKGATDRGIEDKGQKRTVEEEAPIPTISTKKRGRLQESVV